MVKVMTLRAKAMSPVKEAKRGWSWFSLKVPRREVSLQSPFTAVMALARLEILPEVLSNAPTSGVYLLRKNGR